MWQILVLFNIPLLATFEVSWYISSQLMPCFTWKWVRNNTVCWVSKWSLSGVLQEGLKLKLLVPSSWSQRGFLRVFWPEIRSEFDASLRYFHTLFYNIKYISFFHFWVIVCQGGLLKKCLKTGLQRPSGTLIVTSLIGRTHLLCHPLLQPQCVYNHALANYSNSNFPTIRFKWRLKEMSEA